MPPIFFLGHSWLHLSQDIDQDIHLHTNYASQKQQQGTTSRCEKQTVTDSLAHQQQIVAGADTTNPRSLQASKVSVPQTTPVSPPFPTIRPVSWAFAAGLITLSVAALSLARTLFRASKGFASSSSSPEEITSSSPKPLTSTEEEAVNAVGPLLLAAETAAAVDETVHLSMAELEKLDTNLRLLITNMDDQLMNLQDELAATASTTALTAWDAITQELAAVEEQLNACIDSGSSEGDEGIEALEKKLSDLQWEAFGALAGHEGGGGGGAEDTKRTYRSLLFNRGVQSQLLRQVSKQLGIRERMKQVKAQLRALEGERGEGEGSAAGTGPGRSEVSPLTLDVAGYSIPHPRKADTGGEDAFFASKQLRTFGIADGVGGWASLGIDPSEYPRKLMVSCEEGASRHIDPLDILTHAFQETHAPGSCTITLASLDGAVLRIASLGDCGTRIIRDGNVIFVTDVQEHRFNQPFQLGSPQYHPGNIPTDAHRYSVQVLPGDVIVMGSDGLWDNLWDHEVEEIVREQVVEGERGAQATLLVVEELAARLAIIAFHHSKDTGYASPFAAERQHHLLPESLRGIMTSQARGGKPDDITVCCALISSSLIAIEE